MATKAPPVLLVDDNVEFVGLLGTLVAEQGLLPILAHSAKDALMMLDRYSPIAIVVDLLLPDMTGHKLVRAINKTDKELPPIFIITGVFKGQAQQEKMKAIANIAGWYEKPFDTRLLVEEITRQAGHQVVHRGEHPTVGQVTEDYDIDILDAIELDSRRPREAPAEDLDLDIDIDIQDEDDGAALWNVMAAGDAFTPITPVPPIQRTAPSADLLIDEVPALSLSVAPPTIESEAPTPPPDTVEINSPDTVEINPPEDTVEIDPPPVDPFADEPLVNESFANVPVEDEPDPFAGNVVAQQMPEPVFSASSAPIPAPVGGEGDTSDPFLALTTSGFDSGTPSGSFQSNLRVGELETTSVPKLLNAFYTSQETGEIAFERSDQRKIIYFSEGCPVFAVSNQDSDRLGAVARKSLGLTQEQVDNAITIARETNQMMGDVLINQGLVDDMRREDLLREQTRAIVRSLFLWEAGRYTIGFKTHTQIKVELREHPGSLIINAIRDLLELDRLRQLLPDNVYPMPSPSASFDLYQLPLRDAEALLLLKATGKHSVKNLIKLMADRLDERNSRAEIYALITLGVLVATRTPQIKPR